MNILATLNSTVRQLCATPIIRAGAVVVMASGVGLFGGMQKANAAEKIVLTYGYFGRSITVEELEEFAQTGRQTPTLQFLLNATKQEPDDVRQFLQKEVSVNPQVLDKVLNILPGEYVLFQAGRLFHTPERLSNDKALRSSIILSTVDDKRISVIEFLRKYPTREFYVDGYRLANTATDVVRFVNRVGDQLEAPIAIATDLLDDFVCECQSQGN